MACLDQPAFLQVLPVDDGWALAAPVPTSDPQARLYTSPGQTAELFYMGDPGPGGDMGSGGGHPGHGSRGGIPPESVVLLTVFVLLYSPLISFTLR